MRAAFDVIMRIVSTLVGVVMIAMGAVWILQGLNLAFRVGFMVGDKHWVVYGGGLALLGIGQVIWSNTRQLKKRISEAASGPRGEEPMRSIKSYPTTVEADIARMALEAAGVPAVVVGIGVGMEGGAAGVQLLVPDDRIEEALAVLGDT